MSGLLCCRDDVCYCAEISKIVLSFERCDNTIIFSLNYVNNVRICVVPCNKQIVMIEEMVEELFTIS